MSHGQFRGGALTRDFEEFAVISLKGLTVDFTCGDQFSRTQLMKTVVNCFLGR